MNVFGVFFLCTTFHRGQYSLNTFEWTLDVGQETSLDISGQEVPKNDYKPDFKPFKGLWRCLHQQVKIAACVDVFVSGGCELSSTDVDVNTF